MAFEVGVPLRAFRTGNRQVPGLPMIGEREPKMNW
jgi:hypothetical protein